VFAERTLITANDAVNKQVLFFFLRAHFAAQPATALRASWKEKKSMPKIRCSDESRINTVFAACCLKLFRSCDVQAIASHAKKSRPEVCASQTHEHTPESNFCAMHKRKCASL